MKSGSGPDTASVDSYTFNSNFRRQGSAGTVFLSPGAFFMGAVGVAVYAASSSRANSSMAAALWSRGASTRAVSYCVKLRRIDCR